MLILRSSPRRSDLRAFRIACVATLGVAAFAIAMSYAFRPVANAAGAALVVIGSLWLADLSRTEIAYTGWNRLARRVARLAVRWIEWVSFQVIAFSGRLGARVPYGTETSSTGWHIKETLQAGAFESQSNLAGTDRSSWLGGLAAWSGRSGRVWAWALIPYLALLALVGARPDNIVTGKNYTLY